MSDIEKLIRKGFLILVLLSVSVMFMGCECGKKKNTGMSNGIDKSVKTEVNYKCHRRKAYSYDKHKKMWISMGISCIK